MLSLLVAWWRWPALFWRAARNTPARAMTMPANW